MKYIKPCAVTKGRYISINQYAPRHKITYHMARGKVLRGEVEAMKVDWCYIIKTK